MLRPKGRQIRLVLNSIRLPVEPVTLFETRGRMFAVVESLKSQRQKVKVWMVKTKGRHFLLEE
jgi:hypothetical protein